MKRLPVFLVIVLYILIYLLRSQQGGFEFKIDLFGAQRQVLDQKISQFLPSPQAELLSGILLGQNKDLPVSLRLALRDSSTLHIVVASGQNLSLVAGFLLSLSGLVKRRTAIILSLGGVILYTMLTGMQVPILRAALMFILASAAQFFGRPGDSLRVLAITAGALLLVNPKWLFDLSFQLSFLATLGIVALAPVFLKHFKSVPLLGQDLAVTLSAQLMVMPVIIQNFHQLSFISLISNALVLWTIPFIMVGGAIMLVLGTISAFFGQIAALFLGGFLIYFTYIIQFFAGLPFAWEYVGEQMLLVWAGYYMILGGIMLILNNAQKENS